MSEPDYDWLAQVKALDDEIAALKPPKKCLTKNLCPTAAYARYLAMDRYLRAARGTALICASAAGQIKFRWDIPKDTP